MIYNTEYIGLISWKRVPCIHIFGQLHKHFCMSLNSIGSKLLIRELPSIFDGSAKLKAHVQDDSKATLAPKVFCHIK